jgi:hypothetical protein
MDQKAANCGDRLKHGVLLEVLDRLDDWPTITYAETHAGAGIYTSGAELNNIDELRRQVLASPCVSGGRVYFEHLRQWWSDPSRERGYPGSAVSAAHLLLHRYPNKQRELRLTEVASNSCRRLRAALADFDPPILVRLKQESFRDQHVWLTGKGNLVLLVDPFVCSDRQPSDEEAERGYIDVADLGRLLSDLEAHERAIAILWAWYEPSMESARLAIERALYSDRRRKVRQYQNGKKYWIYVAGIGKGTQVVASLPRVAAWKSYSNDEGWPIFCESELT